jgi:hypothetical protein
MYYSKLFVLRHVKAGYTENANNQRVLMLSNQKLRRALVINVNKIENR